MRSSDMQVFPHRYSPDRAKKEGEGMLVLGNEALEVSVLDPAADRARLGTRYCTGGFIFQVEDRAGDPARGILLSGPTFPDSYNVYDGQGAPDAFQPHLVIEQSSDGLPLLTLAVGIGIVDEASNTTREYCAWEIDRTASELRFRTAQAAGPWEFTLERVLTLHGRTLRSSTSLLNTGTRHIPFQWYPHPFFPLDPSGEGCRVSVPVALPENPGFELSESGFLRMKDLPWTGTTNHFQLLGHAGDRPVSFLQRHPVTGLSAAACDYVPTRLPVWANSNTFSFEPYLERNVSPQDAARWSITYDF
jgi:hypothetical protein